MQELIKALINAKKQFAIIRKDTTAHKYKYAQLDQVLEAIKKPLEDNGLVIIQEPYGGDGFCGVATTIWHESGQSISSEFRTKLFKADCQAVGSQLTYYRRYAILSMMGLSPVDDDGKATLPPGHKNAAQPATDPAKNQLIGDILALVKLVTCSKDEYRDFMHTQLEAKSKADLFKMSTEKLRDKKLAIELIAQVQK